jgi:hypothetical protein
MRQDSMATTRSTIVLVLIEFENSKLRRLSQPHFMGLSAPAVIGLPFTAGDAQREKFVLSLVHGASRSPALAFLTTGMSWPEWNRNGSSRHSEKPHRMGLIQPLYLGKDNPA